MARYIDADKLVAWCNDTYRVQSTSSGKAYVNAFLTEVFSVPTADVVEVVRCKDCKYFLDEDEFDSLGMCLCERIARNYGGEIYPERIHFCSYGERKE